MPFLIDYTDKASAACGFVNSIGYVVQKEIRSDHSGKHPVPINGKRAHYAYLSREQIRRNAGKMQFSRFSCALIPQSVPDGNWNDLAVFVKLCSGMIIYQQHYPIGQSDIAGIHVRICIDSRH